MPNKKIVTGQHLAPKMYERSKQLRREMTPTEAILWQHLRAGRLAGFHFRRQQVIDGYIVDFYCHQADLVIEVDGEVHGKQEEYDQARDQHLQTRGLTVLRFENTEVTKDLDEVLARILEVCTQ